VSEIELATQVYAAAHQVPPEGVNETDPGLAEVRSLLTDGFDDLRVERDAFMRARDLVLGDYEALRAEHRQLQEEYLRLSRARSDHALKGVTSLQLRRAFDAVNRALNGKGDVAPSASSEFYNFVVHEVLEAVRWIPDIPEPEPSVLEMSARLAGQQQCAMGNHVWAPWLLLPNDSYVTCCARTGCGHDVRYDL
jgi:hypothetical protein